MFSISRRRLAVILRDIEYNTFDILLISFFEGISVNELCNIVINDESRWDKFDKKVIRLYEEEKIFKNFSNYEG